jgi:hypothetical protein
VLKKKMRKFLIYFLLFVISPVFGNAKVDYDVNNVSFRGNSIINGPRVFVAPAYKKILQQDTGATGSAEADLNCAKNETASFQVIVVATWPGSIADVDIAALEWKEPAGVSKFPSLALFREHYVNVARPSYGLKSKTGMYPDALIPFVNPYTGQAITGAKYLARNQTVAAGNVQGYWIDVEVASDVAAGTYTTAIQVTSAGTKIAEVPVTLHVYNFELPQGQKLKAYFCLLRDLSSVHKVAWGSDAYWQIVRRYQQMLYANGVYPDIQKAPEIDEKTGNVTFTADYVNHLHGFISEFGTMNITIPSLFLNDTQKLETYLADYDAFSKANPWAGQFFYYIDEPSSKQDYSRVKACGEIIKQKASSVKLLVTFDKLPDSDKPNVDDLVDIKVLVFRVATNPNIARYLANSKELWAYTALTSQNNPHWLLDADLLDYRVGAWCCWRLGLTGMLYWQTTYWADTKKGFDPWTQAVSYRNNDGLEWCGEGSLLYPGTDAGIDGPIASMRLKAFRDGSEDYKYLMLLDSLAGKEQTTAIVAPIVSDFQHYSGDPEKYLAARKQIAELILNQMRKK